MMIKLLSQVVLVALAVGFLLFYKLVLRFFTYVLVSRRKYRELPLRLGHLGGLATFSHGGFDRIRNTLVKNDLWPTVANFGCYLNGRNVLAFMTADAVKQILLDTDTFPKHPDAYGGVDPILGQGLVTSVGDIWHSERHLVSARARAPAAPAAAAARRISNRGFADAKRTSS